MSVTIDVKGKLCPLPLIEVKKRLDAMPEGEIFEVLLDNETAKDNVTRFLQDAGCSPETGGGGGQWTVRAVKAIAPGNLNPPESYCSPSAANPVVVFKNDKMGTGDGDLGSILMKAFVNTLKEINPRPSALVFYNSGVFLACEGSVLIPALGELEASGTRLFVCGTCLDFYGLKNKLKVGRISNMLDILEIISRANPPIIP